MKHRRRLFRASVAAVAVIAASAMTLSGGAAQAAKAKKQLDPNATFRFAINYTYSSLSPIPSTSADPWIQPLYDPLIASVTKNGQLTLVPRLAKSYKQSADGLTISFVLRDDVKFQDNTPFNAQAVKDNIEARLAAPTTQAGTLLRSISRVEVVDAYNVVLHLSQPDPGVLWSLTGANAGSMISPTALKNGTDLTKTAVGTGPFKLVSAVQNGQVVYERWDDYWGKNDPSISALVKRVEFTTIPDVNARYNGLRSGQYDATNMSGLDLEASQSKEFKYLAQKSNSYGVHLNSDLPPFNDVRVRRAVSMALDRKAIAKSILDDISQPIFQDFMPGGLGYDPKLDKDPYNPKKAAKLVKDAGADGSEVNCDNHNNIKTAAMGAYVQQALGDIGIKVTLTPFPASNARLEWRTGKYHCYIDGMANNRPDPSQTLDIVYLAVDNPAKSIPAELVSMAAKAKVLPFGSKQREEAYQEIAAWLQKNPVHVPFAQTVYTYLLSKNVANPKNIMGSALQTIGRMDFRGVGIKAGT
jgi:peptide/nickel transport system substrate-binding protein